MKFQKNFWKILEETLCKLCGSVREIQINFRKFLDCRNLKETFKCYEKIHNFWKLIKFNESLREHGDY